MDLSYSAEDIAFREQARTWLTENVPREPRPTDQFAAAAFDREWQRRQYEGGWAGVNWPKEYGGCGLTGVRQIIWLEECVRAGAPPTSTTTFFGLFHAGPTLIVRGSEAQKRLHLPRILNGESLWCQGFSEPGAGSDLAALRTQGVVDGDHLVVRGHKTWTTSAPTADYQELLVRTDPQSKRHKGLTWVICDMKLPGIEIRPIKTMMGESEVNSTFYDDVRIPLSNVVGTINDGWSVAMSTLAFERGTAFMGDQISLVAKVQKLIELASSTRAPDGKLVIEDDDIAYRLAFLKAETVALRAMTVISLSRVERTGQPGPEGSMMKLLVTTVNKLLNETALDILGLRALEYGEDRASNPWTYDYLYSWVYTIAGGSSEIQREIIADRVLELPRAR
ncbi:MAG: acyl-CoA dehydrogenase family protein [Steroidobacteraceae bacterium]